MCPLLLSSPLVPIVMPSGSSQRASHLGSSKSSGPPRAATPVFLCLSLFSDVTCPGLRYLCSWVKMSQGFLQCSQSTTLYRSIATVTTPDTQGPSVYECRDEYSGGYKVWWQNGRKSLLCNISLGADY